MRLSFISNRPARTGPVPRGIALGGPAVLAYGFRPFFLAAGVFAILAMVLWIGALTLGWPLGGDAGPLDWHMHEMLFGYGTAALAGFILTAVPNWTGRLPVSALPLLGLVLVWVAGRLVMLAPGLVGEGVAATVDSAFLPVLAFVIGREVIAGRNWKNLRVLLVISALALANIAFHLALAQGWDEMIVARLGVSLYVVMLSLIGGRIVPSFTRNYLARQAGARVPRPFGRIDQAAFATTIAALALWSITLEGWLVAALSALAAVMQAVRLWGWRGGKTTSEPLLVILHVGYAFVPLGLAAIALAALGIWAQASALHLLTVGAIGVMTLAVMTRASLGHTGRKLTASPMATVSYFALVLAGLIRPLAELVPSYYHEILAVSGLAWIIAFSLFVVEYAPILTTPSLARRMPNR